MDWMHYQEDDRLCKQAVVNRNTSLLSEHYHGAPHLSPPDYGTIRGRMGSGGKPPDHCWDHCWD